MQLHDTMDPPSLTHGNPTQPLTRVRSTPNAPPTAPTSSTIAGSPTASILKTRQTGSIPSQPLDSIRPNDVLGQLSYAPATQTTVVTTVTRTTTEFPPLMMKAPQHLYDLDPKLYPLASSPTPQSIKKLCFDLEGRPTLFQEADDTLLRLEEVC